MPHAGLTVAAFRLVAITLVILSIILVLGPVAHGPSTMSAWDR
jgi:hypothetical protein